MKRITTSSKRDALTGQAAVIFLVCLLVQTLLSQTTAGASQAVSNSQPLVTEQQLSKQLQDTWGIELTTLRLTASDHMIDFRYRVLDAEKAAPLFKRKTKPYLVHEKSGKVLAVPNTAKVGALRNSNIPQEGRIYWMFFGNSGIVQTGDKVSVVIGDFRADNLAVQ